MADHSSLDATLGYLIKVPVIQIILSSLKRTCLCFNWTKRGGTCLKCLRCSGISYKETDNASDCSSFGTWRSKCIHLYCPSSGVAPLHQISQMVAMLAPKWIWPWSICRRVQYLVASFWESPHGRAACVTPSSVACWIPWSVTTRRPVTYLIL